MMKINDYENQPLEEWQPGVTTRMRCSLLTGCRQLCIFDQWCVPGTGVPTHVHAVEKVISVVEGTAEIWVGDETETISAGKSVVVPAGTRHGFGNCGTGPLHLQLALAAPIYEATYENDAELAWRWAPR